MDKEYVKQWYWAIGDLPETMTPTQAETIKTLRRSGTSWRGIAAVAIEELHWDIDATQMAGEQLCLLASRMLGCDPDFEVKDEQE